MQKGDVVLVKFPFTDLSGEKLRPALVLSDETNEGDVVLAFISTQLDKIENNDILIDEDKLVNTGLKTKSIVKLNKLTTINRRIIIGKIGKFSNQTISEVNNKLKLVFKL